ncbi:MAG: energy-coupling factor transporter transmembrane component T [Candidatus Poribacteria bacterium]|nr:energy-coupling factor transporter transmembrane component T [Candidatus Poribacteria bacterium]
MSTIPLHPHTKIIFLAIIGSLVILLDSPISLSVCFLASMLLILISRPLWGQIRLLILFVGLGTWGLIYSQAIFYNEYPRTLIFTLVSPSTPVIGQVTGGVHFYREGLLHGAIQSLRFNTTLTIGCFIIWTTQPRDLLLALIRLRVPYSLAFMVTTALRYLPLIGSEAMTVIRLQRLRGFRYLRLNPIHTISGILNSLRPILTNNIRRATHLGEAVESRAFSPEAATAYRTSVRDLKIQMQDAILISALLVCSLSVVGLKILYFLYANGLYYASWLRGVYTFVREVL